MITLTIMILLVLGIIAVVRMFIFSLYSMIPIFIILFIGAFMFNPWAVVALFVIFMVIIEKQQGRTFWLGRRKN